MSAAERSKRYQAIPRERRRAFEREQAHRFFIELDKCHGACALRQQQAAKILADGLTHYDGVRLRCGDFVIMPNHVHWLVQPLNNHDLESTLGSIKRWSARLINQLNGKNGALWQRESYDRIVRDDREYERTRIYIKENPAKAICCPTATTTITPMSKVAPPLPQRGTGLQSGVV